MLSIKKSSLLMTTFLSASFSFIGGSFASTCDSGITNVAVANGGTCNISAWTPQNNSNDIGQATGFKGAVFVTGGDSVTVTGSMNNFAGGIDQKGHSVKLGDYLTDKSIFDKKTISYGNVKQIEVPDPISGTRIVTVFDSAGFSEAAAAKEDDTFFVPENVDGPDGRGTYINTAFGVVDVNQGGGTLNVNMTGDYYIAQKQSVGLFRAYGSKAGGASAVINVNNGLNFIFPYANYYPAGAQNERSINYTQFTNQTLTVDGKSYTVNDINSLKAYNDALIASMQAGGEVNINNYQTYLNQAYTTTTYKYNFNNENTDGDSSTFAQGGLNAIYATGESAQVNIGKGASVFVYSPINSGNNIVKLDQGATLNNSGTLGGVLTSSAAAFNGSKIINTTDGVINAGVNKADAYNETGLGGIAVYLDEKSTFNNHGIINVTGRPIDSREIGQIWGSGVEVNNSTAVNETDGIINLGASKNGWWSTPVGIFLNRDGGSATNNGAIYLGRNAQTSKSSAAGDLANSKGRGAQTIGVLINNNNHTFVNNGHITFSRYMENGYAIKVTSGNHKVTNSNGGFITIAGGINDDDINYNPLTNFGIFVTDNGEKSDTSFAVNEGTINVTGVNIIALYAEATNNKKANIQNTGVIKIRGNSTYKDGQLQNRNFALQTSGVGAVGDISGTVYVGGNGSVGAYARNGGVINVKADTVFTLQEGKDQIGFVVWGDKSVINSALTTINVATENSIGFYVASGASLKDTSPSDNSLTFNVSGKNSVAILASNSGEKTAANMGNAGNWNVTGGTNVTVGSGSTYNLNGEGAQAIRVEGGATATLNSNSTIVFLANNTTAGTVDGQNYSLFREKINTPVSTSVLTSSANITDQGSSASGVTGFNVLNGGTLNLTADSKIEMSGANNIGAYVNQGNLSNAGLISVKGVGVKVVGANSKISNTGTIKTTGGLASIQLLDNAALTLTGSGSVLADGGAHGVLLDTGANSLTMDGSVISVAGTGNGVENKANITGLKLQNNAIINVENGIGIRSAVTIDSENNGTINVSGQGKGLAFQAEDGSAISTNVDLSKSNALNINVTGNGKGIVVNHSGDGDVKTAANISVGENGGEAVSLTGVKSFTNSGKIESKSTVNPVIVLGTATNVVNEASGLISSSTGIALKFDDQDSSLTNSGKLEGTVLMSAGNNTVLLNAGSSSQKITAGNGTNNFTVKGNATFTELDGGVGGGDDSLNFDGAVYDAATNGKFSHFENLNLKNGTSFTTGETINLTDNDNGIGSVDVDETSSLNFVSSGRYAFNHKLSGKGIVSAVMGSTTDNFTFGDDTGEAFTGRFKAGKGSFNLSGNNTRTLTNATLEVGSGNKTTVGEGDQKIGGLSFGGGTIIFEATPGMKVAKTTISVEHLDANGTGNVQLTDNTGFDNALPISDPNKVSLFEQDDENIITRLVHANSVNYGAGALKLLDQNGNEITNGRQGDIIQNGTKVAEGKYDFRLATDDSGLYVSYGLKELKLLSDDENALKLATRDGATGNATDLSAKLTGAGGINVVEAADKTLSLSNTLNDYTGKTKITSGTLSFRANNVLGNTSALNIAAAGGVDMNGYSQAVGQLNTEVGSKLNIADKSVLTINDQLRSSGDTLGGKVENNTLYGSGQIVIDPSIIALNGVQSNFTGSVKVVGGSQLLLNNAEAFNTAKSIELVAENDKLVFDDLTSYNSAWTDRANGETSVSIFGKGVVGLKNSSKIAMTGNNSDFSGTFDIASGSELSVKEQKNIGSAAIIDNGIFNLDVSTDWAFNNVVTGQGKLNKTGNAALVVKDALAGFTGETVVSAGRLVVGETAASGAKIGGSVKVEKDAVLTGQGEVVGSVTNEGTISALNAITTYTGTTASNLSLGSLINNGKIQLAGSSVGNTLTIKGDYQSNGGSLYLNTVLGDSNSATDSVHILGNAGGNTTVHITNRNGMGALTTGNGINVVKVDGTSNADAFALQSDYNYKGRSAIIAGAYAYSLYGSNAAGNFDGNWYLRSLNTNNVDDKPVDPGNPSKPSKPVYSATAPLYEAYPQILQQLNTVGTLEQRVGSRTWVSSSDNAQANAINEAEGRGFWMKVEGGTGHIESNISKTNASYDVDLVKTLLGLDFIASDMASGKLVGGLYLQYGHAKADIDSSFGTGKINTDGYGFGSTLTWYGNDGLYVDGVGQVMFYDSDIHSNWLDNGHGKRIVDGNRGRGYAASIEVGKKIALNQEWAVTPQMQLSYSDVGFNNFSDNYGGHVSLNDGNALTGRLGVKFDKEVSWKASSGDQRHLKAYGIGNLYYDFLDGTNVDLTHVSFRNRPDRLSAGIGTGLSYSWKDGTYSVYGEVDARTSLSNFGDSYKFNGTVGFKARF